MLSHEDARLIAHLHAGFPLVDRPFALVAEQLGWTEEGVIARLQEMLSHGTLTRFGPLFQIERAGGQFVLAAMSVPEAGFDTVARRVNAFAEVAHNYRRDHALNMWFVIAAESPERAEDAIVRIEAATGLPVLRFPKEREYFVGLKLDPFMLGSHHAAE